jgi:hypothetical protein
VPSPGEEALRDLVRVRTYRHYLAALDVRRTQLATITAEIDALAVVPPLAEPVGKLLPARDRTLSAVTTPRNCRRFS